MRQALGTRGYHGVGLNELLAMAEAPKGVLYHHFPGGKTELALAAVQAVVEQILVSLDLIFHRTVESGEGTPADAMVAWMNGASKALARSGYERGCALAAVALDTSADDVALRQALGQAFTTIRGRLASHLQGAGMQPAQALAFAALIVSAYEGALIQARVAGHAQPMHDTTSALVAALRSTLP